MQAFGGKYSLGRTIMRRLRTRQKAGEPMPTRTMRKADSVTKSSSWVEIALGREL